MPTEPVSVDRSHNQAGAAQALPLPHWQPAPKPAPDQESATEFTPVRRTELAVLLAWILVVIPIVWGFLQTLRNSLQLFQ